MTQNIVSAPAAIKVGDFIKYIHIENPSRWRSRRRSVFFTYKDIETDKDGWVDSAKYLPEDFDLVYIKLRRNKTIPGWINGLSWEGLHLRDDDEVLFWKRKESEEEKCL